MSTTALEEEKKLIDEARRDPDKFGLLFDKHYQQIYNYCLRRTGDAVVAGEITSNVFWKAYTKLWQFKWRGVPFLAWLYRIAGNELKTYYRKNKYVGWSLESLRESAGFEPADSKDIEEEFVQAQEDLERHQQFLVVQEQLMQLDDKYREVLQLRFFEEMKVREIAEVLGKKEGTVKSLISRALAKLRDLSGKEIPADVEDRSAISAQPLIMPNVIPVTG